MIDFALNHMTVARKDFCELLEIASKTGCSAVEVRNDLDSDLFSGLAPADAEQLALHNGIAISAVAEIKNFNDWNQQTESDARRLVSIAHQCGADAISLIPRNDGKRVEEHERSADLLKALSELKPMLEAANIRALIEPLGFDSCSLRYKHDVVKAINVVDGASNFALIHDTFHHSLSGETAFFPQHTAIVHVSGVVDKSLKYAQMTDSDRVLVDESDVLGNVDQLTELLAGGFAGRVSFEAFAPRIHQMHEPAIAISESIEYIRSQLPGS